MAMVGGADAAGESWSELKVGQYFLVWYSDDDVWHERLALWPVKAGYWAVETPDQDRYIEPLDGTDPTHGPSAIRFFRDGRRVPAGVARRYRFGAYLGVLALRESVQAGRDLAAAAALRDGFSVPDVSEVYLANGNLGKLEELFGGHVPWPRPAPSAATSQQVWIADELYGDFELGKEFVIDGARDIVKGDSGVVVRGDKVVRVRKVAAADVEKYIADRRPAVPPPQAEPDDRPLRDRLGLPEAGGGGEAPRGPGDDATKDDCRTLWVEYDDQGERFRHWRSCVRESTTETWPDNPLEGPLTMLHLAKHYDRHGGDPRLWLNLWVRDKKLDPNDRVVHEMKVLMDVMYYAGTYDQLNLGALICLEVVARRAQLIVEAYSVPTRPTWENSKFYSGQASAEDGISPALRAYVAKKAKDESEVMNARHRARELRGGGGGEVAAGAAVEAGAYGGLPSRGGGRGRGRGRQPAAPPGAP